MIGDYTLFRSAVLELGTGDALMAQSAGLLLLLSAGLVRDRVIDFRKRLGRCRAADLASIRLMSGQVSRGSAGEYQSDELAGVARLIWRVSG